jgi:hypothetical protein
MDGIRGHEGLDGLPGVAIQGNYVRHGFDMFPADGTSAKLAVAMSGAVAMPAVHHIS